MTMPVFMFGELVSAETSGASQPATSTAAVLAEVQPDDHYICYRRLLAFIIISIMGYTSVFGICGFL